MNNENAHKLLDNSRAANTHALARRLVPLLAQLLKGADIEQRCIPTGNARLRFFLLATHAVVSPPPQNDQLELQRNTVIQVGSRTEVRMITKPWNMEW